METLNIKEYNLDYIMENYFNTDKEVMFLCDYETAWEILKYSEYENEDFENFTVKLDNEIQYYYIYKDDYRDFVIRPLTIDGILCTIYESDNILIQDSVWDKYKDVVDRCNVSNDLTILKESTNKDSQEQCDCCKCCDECCEEEKDEVLDQIYQQGVKDTLKAIGELFNIEIDIK